MFPFRSGRSDLLRPYLVTTRRQIHSTTRTSDPLPGAAAIQCSDLISIMINRLTRLDLGLLEIRGRGEKKGREKQEEEDYYGNCGIIFIFQPTPFFQNYVTQNPVRIY